MSSPARNRLSRQQWEERAMFGWWKKFPKSPQVPYDRLAGKYPFDPPLSRGDPIATYGHVGPMEEAVKKLEREAKVGATLLAVRRAALTLFYQTFLHYNDSYGNLGEVATEAVRNYSRTNWRGTRIAAEAFWRDFFEVFCLLSNFGVAHDHVP